MSKKSRVGLIIIAAVIVIALVIAVVCSLMFSEPTAKFEGKEAGKTNKVSYEQLADRCEKFTVKALADPNIEFVEKQIESYNRDTAESTIAEIKEDTYAEFTDSELTYDADERVPSGEMRLGYATSVNFYGVLANAKSVSDVDCYFNDSGEVFKVYSANSKSYLYAGGEVSE